MALPCHIIFSPESNINASSHRHSKTKTTPAPQLRRTLRQVVELQRDVQALKASKGGGDGFSGQVASENEFLMQVR
jgi:hypothetical protein